MNRVVSLLIEGDYVDAYLYGGQLIVWDSRGRLAIGSTESLAVAVADASGLPRKAARALFVSDKSLGDEAARTELATTWNDRLSPEAPIHLPLEAIAPEFYSLAPDEHVLDLMVTYNQLYVSTYDSLLSTPLEQPDGEFLRKRLQIGCVSTSPRWGAVSASCAGSGAWALFNETGFGAHEDSRTEQIDERPSVRHTWLGTSLLSFDEEGSIDLLKATVPRRKGVHRVAQAIRAVGDLDDEADVEWWLSDPEDPFELKVADYVTAFSGLLISVADGVLLSTSVSIWSGFPQPFGESEELGRVPGRVVSVVDTSAGLVVETDTQLHYLGSEEQVVLLDRETISLRSYPRSRRHRRTVTATVEGGLLVSVLLGTHHVPMDERHAVPG